MARVELSENEVIEALRTARHVPDPPGVFVISELAKKTGQAPETVRTQIEALRAQGRVEVVKVHREGSDGRQITVNAYRVLREKKR